MKKLNECCFVDGKSTDLLDHALLRNKTRSQTMTDENYMYSSINEFDFIVLFLGNKIQLMPLRYSQTTVLIKC